jgi:CDP-diacylglycerol--glycerol-3-phosphate 3-phosphatidyltransferase
MIKGWWRQLPNAISSARLLATPVLLYAALARHIDLFKWLLLACMVSDILDGLIARIFRLRSPLGARLDSAADMIVFVIALLGLCIFQAQVLAPHWIPLALIVGLYAIEAAGALWRYGRISSFHTILVRISAYAQGIFVMSLFLWGYLDWALYAMTAITVLAYTEEIVLLVLLPQWATDVRGIYWVLSAHRKV